MQTPPHHPTPQRGLRALALCLYSLDWAVAVAAAVTAADVAAVAKSMTIMPIARYHLEKKSWKAMCFFFDMRPSKEHL